METFEMQTLTRLAATLSIAFILLFGGSAIAGDAQKAKEPAPKDCQITGVLLTPEKTPVKQMPLLLFLVYLPTDKDGDGKPLDGTYVLKCDSCPKATTNENGRFTFRNVKKGQFTIGLGADYNESTMRAGNTLTVNDLMLVFKTEPGTDVDLGTIIIKEEK